MSFLKKILTRWCSKNMSKNVMDDFDQNYYIDILSKYEPINRIYYNTEPNHLEKNQYYMEQSHVTGHIYWCESDEEYRKRLLDELKKIVKKLIKLLYRIASTSNYTFFY